MSSDKLSADWSAKKIVRSQSLTIILADHIRELIVNGEIELGTLISENDIANKLSVSRTPVRAALQKLEMERLVQILPQRGTFVFEFNAQEMQQTCEMRQILETGALRVALQHDRKKLLAVLEHHLVLGQEALQHDPDNFRAADTAFHMALIESSQNRDLIDFYQTIINRIRAFLNRLARTSDELQGSQRDHETIVALLREARDEEAQEKLHWHLGGLQRMFQEKYARQ